MLIIILSPFSSQHRVVKFQKSFIIQNRATKRPKFVPKFKDSSFTETVAVSYFRTVSDTAFKLLWKFNRTSSYDKIGSIKLQLVHIRTITAAVIGQNIFGSSIFRIGDSIFLIPLTIFCND